MLEIVNTFKIATEEEKENFKNRASDALKVADTPNAFLGWLLPYSENGKIFRYGCSRNMCLYGTGIFRVFFILLQFEK